MRYQFLPPDPSRRRFLQNTLGATGLLGLNALLPAYARPFRAQGGAGRDVSLDFEIGQTEIDIAGARALATTINGGVPGPLVELYEGHEARLRVHNRGLEPHTSIHWHGLLLPFEMDGVPGVVYPGVPNGESFEHRFQVRQSGTYWYHSHSGLQEQSGVYGPLICHPAEPDPFAYDRDYVVLLSDWTFEDPHDVLAKLKAMPDYYNYSQPTVGDLVDQARTQGWGAALKERLAWNRMRMNPTDIADVTGATYTYLMNGQHPAGNWTGLFQRGERIRLRFINAAAMSYFDVRIPGLPMTVVQADGQNVKPVEVDEFRIGVAETYDVIVTPGFDEAYTVFAESMDRSGYARGTLATREGLTAAVPTLRKPPRRTMADMGHGDMNHAAMEHGGTGSAAMGHGSMDHGAMGQDMSAGDQKPPSMRHDGMDHAAMGHQGMQHGGGTTAVPVQAADGGPPKTMERGPGVAMVAMNPVEKLDDPGIGLRDVEHRVLVYSDLEAETPNTDHRAPEREIQLHLTSNMERYMWSFDGVRYHEVDGPIHFKYGERLKLTLINNTMMEHPIHLHGMFVELDNGKGMHRPRKHTLNVNPGQKLSMLITADEPGRWAFHCHLLYHMEMGMFRVVEVS